ncbi:MAG: diaminopimelate decarboxylase [Clostridia bacterium]|nr:diaminopimelate decarboxylase [Clostridia bacterium]
MLYADSLSVSPENHLMIGRHDAVALAREFGTPLYVLDEDLMRRNCREYRETLRRFCGERALALFASKALCTLHTARVAAEEGLGADAVSGGEIYTLLKAGFPMDKVYFHGNNKSAEEISLAMDSGVGYFVVDNRDELERVSAAACRRGLVQKILFRVKPGVDCHTHDYIKTGQIDSKFGVALETGEAYALHQYAASLPGVRVEGVHCHIGSQIFEIEPFLEALRRMMALIARLRKELNMPADILNLGGGFGIRYEVQDDPPALADYMRSITATLRQEAERLEIDAPFLVFEPGRAIVGAAGVTLYTVGSVKVIPGVRTYVAVDGGMGDNPRYALYGARHPALIADRAGDAPSGPVTIAGKCCESGDLIAVDTPLPPVRAGDTLAVLVTGAYNYSMASNYNRLPRPAMVALRGDEKKIIVRRETYEDVISHDVL